MVYQYSNGEPFCIRRSLLASSENEMCVFHVATCLMNSGNLQIRGLALSGGGFRATLFHLGVVRGLVEAGLMHQVKSIACVSGGSVLAAHVALNWATMVQCSESFQTSLIQPEKLAAQTREEATKAFECAMEPLLALIELDLRNRILRRLPFTLLTSSLLGLVADYGFVLTSSLRARLRTSSEKRKTIGQLAVWLDELYAGKTLESLPTNPEIVILTTDVAAMKHAWFSRNGFHSVQSEPGRGSNLLTISQAVSASCAFPALFAPFTLNGADLVLPNSDDSFVTDAGVYDNLGVSCFLNGTFIDSDYRVLVSDATATSDWTSRNEPGLLSNLLRSVDIMQQRTAQLQREKVGLPQRNARQGTFESLGASSGRFVIADIATQDLRDAPKISAAAQPHVSYMRTDLDCFAPNEMRVLTQHGFSVAWHTLKKSGVLEPSLPSGFQGWAAQWPRVMQKGTDAVREIRDLRRSRRSRIKLLSLGDTYGVLYWLLIAILACALPAFFLAKQQGRQKIARSRIEVALNTKRTPLQPIASTRFSKMPAPELNFNGLEVKSFERIFDLRSWQFVPESRRAESPEEPAYQQTIYSLRRSSNATHFPILLKTGGVGIGIELQPFEGELYQRSISGMYSKEIQAVVKIDWIPEAIEYPIVLRSTFWNGFQGSPQHAGFTAAVNSDYGRMIILFPENRVPRKIRFWTRRPHSDLPETPAKMPFHVFLKNGLFFEFENLKANHAYGVMFTWNDEGVGQIGSFTPKEVGDLE